MNNTLNWGRKIVGYTKGNNFRINRIFLCNPHILKVRTLSSEKASKNLKESKSLKSLNYEVKNDIPDIIVKIVSPIVAAGTLCSTFSVALLSTFITGGIPILDIAWLFSIPLILRNDIITNLAIGIVPPGLICLAVWLCS